jgi:hypothetical protein
MIGAINSAYVEIPAKAGIWSVCRNKIPAFAGISDTCTVKATERRG